MAATMASASLTWNYSASPPSLTLAKVDLDHAILLSSGSLSGTLSHVADSQVTCEIHIAAFWATLAAVIFFAVLLLVAGVVQIADATATRYDPGFGWRLGIGILTAVVGGLILFDPVSGAIGLTLLIGMFFIFLGVAVARLGLAMILLAAHKRALAST